jgi:RpiR family transcriptional regulator, carbohydrate utilization regulator
MQAEQRDLISILKKAYPDLRSSEQKVADFIFDHPDDVPRLNITELAKRCDTSESTVTRLCHSIEVAGYGELKILLAHRLASGGITTIPQSIKENDDLRIITEKMLYVFSDTIKSTYEVLDISELEKAVEKIYKAERLYFYGVGGSGSIARVAHHLFLKAGIVSTVYDDGYMQAVSAALLKKGDVAIGISHSGSTKDIVGALEIAKKAGAHTIAITGNQDSAIIDTADIKLVTFFKEDPIYGDFMEAKIGQLFIIDLLYIGVVLRNIPAAMRNLEDTAAAIWDRSYIPSLIGVVPRRKSE